MVLFLPLNRILVSRSLLVDLQKFVAQDGLLLFTDTPNSTRAHLLLVTLGALECRTN